MTNEQSPLKAAIMDAVYVPIERDDMQTQCTLPFMTSSEHGVCDGEGCPVSDETIASALNAVAKIQAEYYKVKKGTQKGTQKEMTDEASPRPWRTKQSPIGSNTWIVNGETFVASASRPADAALIVAAVNERDRLRDIVLRLVNQFGNLTSYEDDAAILREARSAIGEDAP